MLLPNRLVFPSLAMAAGLLVVAAVAQDDWDQLWRAGVGAVAASGGLLLIGIAWPRGNAMGGGDIKLALLLGLCLGWIDLGHVPFGLFLGFLLGSIAGVVLLAAKAKRLQEHFAFGPFLAAGTLLAVWFGRPFLDWYAG
jgi:leader peptidase (prepilin peptidase)/N-methyltransferase